KLMAAAIRQRFGIHRVVAGELLIEFRTRIGVRDGYLDRLHVEFFGEVECALDRLLGFSGKPDDEISVNPDADLLAILRELPCLLDRRALLDVLQNLRIAGFVSYNEEPRASICHGFQGLVIARHARRARPAESDRLELRANIENALLADVERIVIEEKFLRLRKQRQRLLHFPRDVLGRANAPLMTR